jgi:hypothetical protein
MNTVETKERYNLNLSENGIQTIGTVQFDEANEATVSIMVNGQVTTTNQISAKELRVLSAYFSHIAKDGVRK